MRINENDPLLDVIIRDITKALEVQDTYGEEVGIEQFPGVLNKDYRGLWRTFLSTSICSDIIKSYKPETYSNVLVVGAFISHLLKFGKNKDVFRKGKILNINSVYNNLLSRSIYMSCQDINSRFKKYALNRDFKVSSHVSTTHFDTNDFINAMSNVSILGSVVFKLDENSKLTMSNAVALLSGTMFSRIPDMLSDSTISLRQQEHVLLTLPNSDAHFVPLVNSNSLSIHVARSKSDSLVFLYKESLPILYFYKTKRIEYAARKINSMWRESFLSW